MLCRYASRSPARNDAADNVFCLYDTWLVANQGAADSGSLVFKAEYRGKLGTSLSPQALGPTLGYAGLTTVAFSDADAPLTNFHWTQAFADNRFPVIAGVVDVTDHLDVHALVNPWTEFSNLSFSTNPTIPAPNQGLGEHDARRKLDAVSQGGVFGSRRCDRRPHGERGHRLSAQRSE